MTAHATKLQAAENDLKQLMADVTRAMEKAQEAVKKIASKAATAATGQNPPRARARPLASFEKGQNPWLINLLYLRLSVRLAVKSGIFIDSARVASDKGTTQSDNPFFPEKFASLLRTSYPISLAFWRSAAGIVQFLLVHGPQLSMGC